MSMLLWGMVVAAPALLADPGGAREAALDAPKSDARRAAETLVLLGDGQGALDVLRETSVDRDDPRTVRLVVEALEQLQDASALRLAAARLEAHPGWRRRARAARRALDGLWWRRQLERTGLGLFAMGLALLGIGGARSLLAIRWATVTMGLATLAAVGLATWAVPRVTPVPALLGVGFMALAHAASATVERTRPDARGRALTATLMLLAAAGLVVGVVARLSVPRLLGLLTP